MSTYMEAVMLNEAEMLMEYERDTLIRAAVTAALDIIDEKHPEFKKSKGPFGDELAADLHRRFEKAFKELDAE